MMKELKIALYKMRIAFAREKARYIDFDYDVCEQMNFDEYIEKAGF